MTSLGPVLRYAANRRRRQIGSAKISLRPLPGLTMNKLRRNWKIEGRHIPELARFHRMPRFDTDPCSRFDRCSLPEAEGSLCHIRFGRSRLWCLYLFSYNVRIYHLTIIFSDKLRVTCSVCRYFTLPSPLAFALHGYDVTMASALHGYGSRVEAIVNYHMCRGYCLSHWVSGQQTQAGSAEISLRIFPALQLIDNGEIK